ncbi:MAG TPA: pseudouridine synthase [Geobacteraceae bacterium]
MRILYRDDLLAALAKPAGLLVHRSPIDRRETRFALQLARDLLGQRVYPVHRLDRATSGVLLFALTPAIAHTIMQSFAAGAVTKTYLAVVRGVTAESGTIDYPLTEPVDRLEPFADQLLREAQTAVTDYQRLATAELPVPFGPHQTARYSLVAATPRTGRRHQLRRHFKHLRQPLIGDTTYGDGRHNRLFREQLGCHRLLLHAVALTVPHPASGSSLTITAPLEGEFLALVERFGWQAALPAAWL